MVSVKKKRKSIPKVENVYKLMKYLNTTDHERNRVGESSPQRN